MNPRKFTDEQALPFINDKRIQSVAGVLRAMHKNSISGSSCARIKSIAAKYKLNTDHWLGQRIGTLRAGVRKNNLHLVLRRFTKTETRPSTHELKLKLIHFGVKRHVCEECGLVEWLGKPIPLELHHVDGDNRNYEVQNLKILCPNCHALTDNYCGKGKIKVQVKKVSEAQIASVVPKCQSISEVLKVVGLNGCGQSYETVKRVIENKKISLKPRSLTEKEIDRSLKLRKVIRPSAAELEKMLLEKPAAHVARELGVSGSAIVKWCKFYQIRKPARGYWACLKAYSK